MNHWIAHFDRVEHARRPMEITGRSCDVIGEDRMVEVSEFQFEPPSVGRNGCRDLEVGIQRGLCLRPHPTGIWFSRTFLGLGRWRLHAVALLPQLGNLEPGVVQLFAQPVLNFAQPFLSFEPGVVQLAFQLGDAAL
jgi:hypothetical protein